MKTTIPLRITITTEDDEVLESAQIILGFDLAKYLTDRENMKAMNTGIGEAGSTYESALRIAFTRAKKGI
ncbi:hypothetical protein Rctr197k_139 [Virus Rctr197k]|nr:hypothetical protein Rctr197k_139 [Virus Rctr197k]